MDPSERTDDVHVGSQQQHSLLHATSFELGSVRATTDHVEPEGEWHTNVDLMRHARRLRTHHGSFCNTTHVAWKGRNDHGYNH